MPPSFQSRQIIIAALLAITVFSGVVHGYLDGRWASRDVRAEQVDLLTQIPAEVGDWRLMSEKPLEGAAQRLLRCYGSSTRVYQNVDTGDNVTVAVLFGPRGPIAVHTPDVCYTSQGTKADAPRSVRSFNTNQGKHRLWSIDFKQGGERSPSLNVLYGWSSGGDFSAADNPRFWLTDDLYKLQVAGPITGSATKPSEAFLKAFLPHLEKLIQ
ncbi:exosortase-associated EpsI family protein [Roseiconus lacunae]|uniref:exosortase-associated EpsI family protein n=1 Tax=Roseiconus lacunae TaxID=2605694 RepID=UPI0011F3D6EF|nr:exosortase-associated EpsI family protein [Roseiconus lacunae]MCD0458868.1 EpsI family protein [Roseiconus lacunae]WRQ49182.1 exosortase-associated EpsI family protein [Stieleria sp. HD01]